MKEDQNTLTATGRALLSQHQREVIKGDPSAFELVARGELAYATTVRKKPDHQVITNMELAHKEVYGEKRPFQIARVK